MNYECFTSENSGEMNEYFVQIRPSSCYNTDSLIRRIVNQGDTTLNEEAIKSLLEVFIKTIKNVLIEGGMVTINDFLILSPSAKFKPENNSNSEIDNNKMSLSIKASLPLSFCESIAMEAELNHSINKNQ